MLHTRVQLQLESSECQTILHAGSMQVLRGGAIALLFADYEEEHLS